jgi:hypothetical protein
MLRTTVCALALAAVVALAPAARAGELDRESAPTKKSVAMSAPTGGSEMDKESPQAAYGWHYGHRWGGWGWGHRWGGWGGWGGGWGGLGWGGFYPARFSYFNFGFPGFYRPWGFYNGFSLGFGYRSFFPTYYSPLFWW